ncbi:acyltransferase family protein [Novosphingobium album (ex Hu et al. 2023)]|uniref:Acyltransferase n=1 Tax=Novosphingobium album (ex Hu et al. 2023) TaxID=2930093 RepID=A0ABT0AWK1_9SPHN|nr:acyltransferase [Novosphingobium album (ex Hu et al. 2023)]MCJ2177140.1 acyltransferase [Novosphingobium album (ex Hu et al. 2023)]
MVVAGAQGGHACGSDGGTGGFHPGLLRGEAQAAKPRPVYPAVVMGIPDYLKRHPCSAAEIGGKAACSGWRRSESLPSITEAERPVRPDDGGRYEWVDALRLIAALAVFVQHSFESANSAFFQAIPPAISPGVFGVVLFFVISGFVMPLSVRGHFDLRKFALRRIFRIFPGVLFCYAVMLLLPSIVPPYHLSWMWTAGWKAWAANLLLIQDYVKVEPFLGVTWTLSLEFAWYGAFALCWWWRRERSIDMLCKAATVLIIVVTVASLASGHRAPLGRLGMLYAATIGAQSYRWIVGEISSRRMVAWIAVFLVAMMIANLVAFGYFTHPDITLAQSFWPWLIAPAIYFTAVALARGRSTGRVTAFLARLGKVSFSIYMLHGPAIVLTWWVENALLRILAALVLTLCASFAMYRWVELPGIAMGRYLAKRITARQAQVHRSYT